MGAWCALKGCGGAGRGHRAAAEERHAAPLAARPAKKDRATALSPEKGREDERHGALMAGEGAVEDMRKVMGLEREWGRKEEEAFVSAKVKNNFEMSKGKGYIFLKREEKREVVKIYITRTGRGCAVLPVGRCLNGRCMGARSRRVVRVGLREKRSLDKRPHC